MGAFATQLNTHSAALEIYWKLDETSGTAIADSSGNGRSGTISGGYTLAFENLVATEADNSIDFDRATAGEINSDANLNLTLSGGCTALAWVKAHSFAGSSPFISSIVTVAATQYVIVRWGDASINPDQLQFVMQDGTTEHKFTSTTQFSTDTIYFLVASWDTSAMQCRVYDSGGLVEEFGGAASTTMAPDGPFQVNEAFTDNRHGDQVIGHVAFLSDGLTDAEADDLHAAGIGAAGQPMALRRRSGLVLPRLGRGP